MEVRESHHRPGQGVTTVAVLGPGAVGGALAVPLALCGADVVCIGRAESIAAIEREGLTLVRQGEEFHARLRAAETLRESVDLLLITVKAPGLDRALDRVEADPAIVLPLLNGIEHMEVVRSRLGGHVVAGTIGLLEAYREGPTRIVQTTRGPAITAAERLSLPGFEVRVVPERTLLWDKVARMAPLAAATAITQQSIGELRDDSGWRPRLERSIAEACAIGTADGAQLSFSAQWEIIEKLPPTMTTSAARDVAAGRPSELDAITGAVVRAAARLDVPAPTLAELWEEACRAQSH
jgi:2-dehydropantoate 2-reductase